MSYWLEGGENQSHLLSQKPLHAEPAVEGWRPPSRAACYPEHGPLAKAQGDTLGQASSIKKPSSHGRTAEANKSAMLEATTKEIKMRKEARLRCWLADCFASLDKQNKPPGREDLCLLAAWDGTQATK